MVVKCTHMYGRVCHLIIGQCMVGKWLVKCTHMYGRVCHLIVGQGVWLVKCTHMYGRVCHLIIGQWCMVGKVYPHVWPCVPLNCWAWCKPIN